MNIDDGNTQKVDRAAEQQAYDALQAYTLGHGGSSFVHQHVVDAWAAQHADESTKPIGLVFALIGLCLHVERGRTGREVQRVHMLMGQRKHAWPRLPLPGARGAVTARQVMAAPAGPERDRMIDAWCVSVWNAFGVCRPAILELLRRHDIS